MIHIFVLSALFITYSIAIVYLSSPQVKKLDVTDKVQLGITGLLWTCLLITLVYHLIKEGII